MAVPPTERSVRPVPFPDGVGSPDGRTGFVELRSGGIAALELNSGGELWTATIPARPCLVVGDRLVAYDRARSQDNALAFVTFDLARRGEVDRRLDPVMLPEWLSVTDPDQIFDYDVWAEGDELVVEWHAESHYHGGAPPPTRVLEAARREARGRARVHLRTGRVVSQGEASSGPPPAAAEQSAGGSDTAVEAALAAARAEGAQSLSMIGSRVYYLVEPEPRAAGAGLRLVGRDLETGKTLWERTLPGRPRTGPPARRM